MTPAVTPGREAPKTPISPVATRDDLIAMIHNRDALVSDLKEALASARLASKPSDEVREATIEECAKVCDRWISSRNLHESLAAIDIKRDIFRLSTTGETKP